jgi:hypothetical protein|tara:strand:+ start:2341 stop:2607 length:267 start_codon:yes stop_codon:yes gene_type:complete
MADVTVNISGTTERNGSVVVGAPKGSTTPLGSQYTMLPGDSSDLVVKGAVGGVNDAKDYTFWDTKYDSRFDDVRYYTGDCSGVNSNCS